MRGVARGRVGSVRALPILLSLCLLGAECYPSPAPTPPAFRFDTRDVAERLAAQAAVRWEPDDLGLDWIQTVLTWGFLRLHAADPAAGHDSFAVTWMDSHLAEFGGADPKTFNSSDSMSPASVAAYLMADDVSRDYTPVTDAAASYLATLPRTVDGAFPHWGPEHALFGDTLQVWVDSQFMIGMTLIQEFRRTGEQALLTEWVAQYRLFSQLCRDADDQLYRHAWDDLAGVNIPAEPVYWNRGNSWVLVSAAEFLRLAPGHPDAPEIEALFVAHLEATAITQREDGLFWTVLNAPMGDDARNYSETSGSALIGYAIAVGIRTGLLSGDPWRRALSGIVAGVAAQLQEEDGRLVLHGTSFGTNPGDYDNYVNTPTLQDQIVGVGAVLMLLAEVHGMEAPVAGPFSVEVDQ